MNIENSLFSVKNKRFEITMYGIKILCCVFMAFDHAALIVPSPKLSLILRAIPRPFFVVIPFMLAEGYKHTSNLPKYMTRLFIFALVTQPFYCLFFNYALAWPYRLNAMFTLFLGLMCMYVWDTARHKWFAALFCALTAYLGQICNVEGGAWLVIFTFMFRLITDGKRKFIASYSVLYVGNYLPLILKYALKHDRGGLLKNMLYLFCALWGALLIFFYNGRQGRRGGYFFYIFYPAHLALLGAIKLLIN